MISMFNCSMNEHISIKNEFNLNALIAYINVFDLSPCDVTLDDFSNRYRGYFTEHRHFVEHNLVSRFGRIPTPVIKTYDTIWNFTLSEEYSENNGHYFRK